MADDTGFEAIVKAVGIFSRNMMKNVLEKGVGNLIASPLSAHIVTAMGAYGACGETASQMRAHLHIPSDDAFGLSGFTKLTATLNEIKNVDLHIANKIFIASTCSVKEAFKELTSTKFSAESQELDFVGSPALAADIINEWCSKQTNNRIKEIMKPANIDGNTRLLLLNATYFKGTWEDQFNASRTFDAPFHVNETVVKDVPTMHKKHNFKCGTLPELDAKFIELSYKGDEFSMIIVLPNEITGLNIVLESVHNPDMLDTLLNGHRTSVDLHLPKFRIESELNLKEIFIQMGMTDMFGPNKADFSGISDEGLSVSQIIQKAFIEVNEEGTEAAAVTRMVLKKRSMRRDFEFHVDRPFWVQIVHKPTKIGLFEAVVTLPTY